MLTRLLDDLKAAPERIRSVPTRLADRRRNASRWARQRVHTARNQTEERLYNVRLGTLETVDGLLDRTVALPVIGRIASPAATFVSGRVDALTAAPVDGYDELNAREAIAALKDLDRLPLLIALRYEAANKDRKTVKAAIEREIEKREAVSLAA